MKSEVEQSFRPVKLVLETQEEIDAMQAFFQCVPLMGLFEQYSSGFYRAYDLLSPYVSSNYQDMWSNLHDLVFEGSKNK